ncbi:glycosyl transferase [Deinococcus malanensis]|uniref:Glycosyl transferase n=2 Tax=Deinococcus malanensis TaxID=1706855 RepID=A0ABQ2ETP3_9DEIO|nr:glycosyl transferase [Deinococcus malanensis]
MERVAATVAGGLTTRGFDVEILTLWGDTSAYPLPSEVRLTTLGLSTDVLEVRKKMPQVIRAIRQHLKRRRPDTLIVTDTFLSLFATPAAFGLRVRQVAWEHFNFHFSFGMRSRQLARGIAAHLAQDVVTLTQRDVAQWRSAFPRARARLQSITNPMPFPSLTDNPYALDSRTVLAVGWLDRRKGFDLLLEAWARVQGDFPGWSLKIIGTGEEEEALRAQAASLGLERWALAPQTSHIEQEYRNAGVFVLPSRFEGLPMVLIESQAHGVPAVAFDCLTGPAEIFETGGGVLVPLEDVEGFARELGGLMADTAARQGLSERAFQGTKRYERERVLDHWMTLLGAR